ncbi:hypothetical protein GCM10010405_01280 [Streptomyces macrosporus]|uniref:Transposase n=1 Tax=Streptomyces macrosporus TaxID=44032 RepID=A0ABP5W946_9ACTN
MADHDCGSLMTVEGPDDGERVKRADGRYDTDISVIQVTKRCKPGVSTVQRARGRPKGEVGCG